MVSGRVRALVATTCAVLAAADGGLGDGDAVWSAASNESLLWGPYRPNVYFGVRPRVPQSLLTGLLWGRVEDYTSVQNDVRFTCEQHAGMAGYGWDVYDPRSGGVQTVHDKGNGIDVETSFVKFDGGRGGWGARIRGTPRADAPRRDASTGGPESLKTAVWFTVSVEGLGAVAPRDSGGGAEAGFSGDVVLEGDMPQLGEFRLAITAPDGQTHPLHSHASSQQKPLDRTFVHSTTVAEEALWQSKAILFQSLKATIDGYVAEYTQQKMPPPWQTYTVQHQPGPGNMHIIQKTFEGPFAFDVLFTPSTAASPATSAKLTAALHTVVDAFGEKYLHVHKPRAPFTAPHWLEFSKALFSNLIGGIGYFHGSQVIDRSYAPEYDEENEGFWEEADEARARNAQKMEGPSELFTSVPSRPFFPRGFLWDEGFHLLPILDWDTELAMQIVSSWYNTMDDDGWIAREQVLGAEAQSKVPSEFLTQYPHYANPPTLFMVVEAILDKIEHKAGSGADLDQNTLGHVAGHHVATPESIKAWFKQLYPLLQRNFDWYRKTQYGDLKTYERNAFSSKEGYRWRGRTPRHILTSGLDDYPRAQPPHPGELHLDLISWIGLMSRNIQRIAAYLGETDDAAKYGKITDAIRRNVDDIHWSQEHNTYCDTTIDDYEETAHVCHKGYISIFPLMTGLLDANHKHLPAILDLIADEDELWSPHGVRSLSKKDELYGTEENYWRSPVWLNMNYLIVKELYTLSTTPGPQQLRSAKLYSSLRKNLVETVYNSWKETGFAWEQYNPETGAGQRTQHFTGWTSLVVKIMAMPDVGGESGHDEL